MKDFRQTLIILPLFGGFSLICGLSFHPKPPQTGYFENKFIWYNSSDPSNYEFWINKAKKFLKVYEDLPKIKQVDCDFDHLPGTNEVCSFKPNSFAPCNEENSFGFNGKSPCLFLMLDKIFEWIPEIYNDSKTLPDEMPVELKQHIKKKEALKPNEIDMVWVSCEGENPADVIHLKAIDFYPRRGFPYYYFPVKNIEGYLPPIIAVQLTVETGVIVEIECKAWARNLHNNGTEEKGYLQFELFID